MRAVKKWVYYCDYCKKSNRTKPSMFRHEARCTANPERVCGLCEKAGFEQKPIAELIAAFEVRFSELRRICDCPACIFATIRQSGAFEEAKEYCDEDGPMPHREWQDFDFREEMKNFWSELREADRMEHHKLGSW